jgi:hypothetical protein
LRPADSVNTARNNLMEAGSRRSAAPERAALAATAPLSVPGAVAADGRAPLAFITFGLAWLAIAAGWLAARADLLGYHHAIPGTVALVHAWVLGCLLPVAFGAVYQLLPVVLGIELADLRLAWVHFVLHVIGASCLVLAMTAWRMDLVALAAAPVIAGVLLFAVNVWRTVGRTRWSRDPVALAFALAAGWLAATVCAGTLLAVNKVWYFLPLSPLALLQAHAHLGVIGFFVTLLQGATFRLVPMFTLSAVKNWRRVWAGLLATQAGLIALIPALVWEKDLPLGLSAIAICAGVALSGWELASTLAARNKRGLVAGLRGFVAGAALFVGAAAGGLILALPGNWTGVRSPKWAMLYGLVALLGGLAPMVLGMLCKIVPFLVWLRVYAPLIGRRRTPPATGLATPSLERAWLLLHGIGLGGLAAGVLAGNDLLLRLGAWVFLVGIGSLLINFGIVLSHLWHAREPCIPLAAQPFLL